LHRAKDDKDYFIYSNEQNEKLHYNTSESEDTKMIKGDLIRTNVKEGEVLLDGYLIESIFEYPNETHNLLNNIHKE
jgi:hypothetical protein